MTCTSNSTCANVAPNALCLNNICCSAGNANVCSNGGSSLGISCTTNVQCTAINSNSLCLNGICCTITNNGTSGALGGINFWNNMALNLWRVGHWTIDEQGEPQFFIKMVGGQLGIPLHLCVRPTWPPGDDYSSFLTSLPLIANLFRILLYRTAISSNVYDNEPMQLGADVHDRTVLHKYRARMAM